MSHEAEYAALVGIDWADTKHDCCLRAIGADLEAYGVMGHMPEAIDHWAKALADRFLGSKIAICLEQSKGSLIYALLKYDHLVLYPINPRMLAKFRDAFAPSGKKDDPADAQLLLELVSKHREKLQPWRPADEPTRTRQFFVEPRRTLVNDKTRLTNRLTSVLKGLAAAPVRKPTVAVAVLCSFRQIRASSLYEESSSPQRGIRLPLWWPCTQTFPKIVSKGKRVVAATI
jgi:transposase